MSILPVEFSRHALERMEARGTDREEVNLTIRAGHSSSARQGRTAFRKVFDYGANWNGTYYDEKEIKALAVEEEGRWVVITVIVRYFS